MVSATPTICNYCEGQAFDKGRCLGCGASSWKSLPLLKWVGPNPRSADVAVDAELEKTESDFSSVFIELCKTAIRLVEKLVSTALAIFKYKLLLLFTCLLLAAFTGSFTEKRTEQSHNVKVLNYKHGRPAEQSPGGSIGIMSDSRFKPIPKPSPVKLNNEATTETFSKPNTEWGAHFNPAGLVPEKGFLAFYFDRSNPTQLVQPVAVNNIDVSYKGSDFRGIYSRNFGAYWVGMITTNKAETIEIKADKGWNEFRVIIDGSVVQEHSRGSGPTLVKQVTVQHRMHRDPDEEVRVLQEPANKVYPKTREGNPLVTLSPGDHLIEVELLNNWHTTDFSVQFKKQ